MNAASFSNFHGGCVDCEMRAIRFLRGTLASHSSSSSTTIASGAKPEQADDLRVVRGAEQDDRVALVDELQELPLLLDDPGAGAVDDLEAALVRPLHDVRSDAVRADDDRRAVIDVVEGLDRPDAHRLEVRDDALVVDDLAQGVRQLAGGRRLLGLVDRLANAVAEPGALRDPDRFDGSHLTIKYRMRSPIDPLARTTRPVSAAYLARFSPTEC